MKLTLLKRIQYMMATLFLSVLTAGAATIGQETMVNLTLNDGLAGETVNHVMTDHNGYVWIATNSGVNVYNGKNLQTHRILNAKGQAVEVFYLCETKSKDIFAATDQGLYRLSPSTNGFKHFLPEVTNAISLFAVGDTLYIGGEQGLQYWDGEKLYRKNMGASRQGLDNIVRFYAKDKEGLIWFLGRHDLGCFNPKTEKVTHYDLTHSMNGKQPLRQFIIVEGQTKKFYIGTRSGGLFVYDLKSREAHHVDGVGQLVMSVYKSNDGYICAATDGSGAYLIDSKTEQVVRHYNVDATGMERLPTNAVYSFYRDTNGVNWFGFVRYGLTYEPHNSHLFTPYSIDGFSTLGLNIRCFHKYGDQTVLGLQDGLWVIDTKRHLHKYFSAQELGGHIVNNIIYWNDHFWIGTYDGGVRMLNPQSLEIQKQPYSPLLDHCCVGHLRIGPDNSMWVGCSHGLFIIQKNGAIRRFTEQNSAIVGGIIIDINFDKDGNAWLSGAKGLSLYSAASQDIVKANFPEGFWNEMPYMRGITAHDGTIFMRNGPQLFYSRNDMQDFGEIVLPIRLSDKWCRSMADDGMGHLLLASERGLLRITYEGKQLMLLGTGEGLRGTLISEVQIDANDNVWVATSNGLFTASGKKIKDWENIRHYMVTLHQVRKGSDLLSLREMSIMCEERKIRLSWHFTSQVFQAEPILLDYAHQSGRLYEYQIDGGTWQLVDNGQLIDVRHLLIGTHQLTVRMAGVPGTETKYQLTVVPSVLTVLELLLMLVGIVLLWLWWRYRKNTKMLLSERNEIEEALIEIEQELQEVEEVKSEEVQKYQKVKIDEQECADIVIRMKEYIEREKVYTNADLKMKDLADVLHLSAPKLSQVFNLYLNENYYEFINQYRLDEFKRLIAAGEYQRFTITALSEQSGFKKSNFFSTFRKVEGMTPAEYLKKEGIKV